MTPNRLRDILLARGGRVSLDDLRKCEAYKSDSDMNEAIAFLIETGLAIHHGDSVQAKRGCGRLVERGDALTPRRLSAILHGLRASGRITLRRHCDVYKARLPVRQEWRPT